MIKRAPKTTLPLHPKIFQPLTVIPAIAAPLANLREAIDLYVQDLLEAGEQIPVAQGTIELPEPAVVVNV